MSASKHDLVFARLDSRPHDPDVITQQFETATRRAGMKRIRLHDCRHTHASLLLEAGVHPKVVQERLGHSSVMVTLDRYFHVVPNMQADAAIPIRMVVDGSDRDAGFRRNQLPMACQKTTWKRWIAGWSA